MRDEKRRDWRKVLAEISPSEEELEHLSPRRRELWRLIEEARTDAEAEAEVPRKREE